MVLVVGLIIGFELAGYGGTGSPERRAEILSWAPWLLMSGNGFLLSWALLCGEAGARIGGQTGPLSGPGFGPGLAAVMLLTCWIVVSVAERDTNRLAALVVPIYGPTLLVGFGLVGSGLGRLKRLWHAAAVLAALALVNGLCQLAHLGFRVGWEAGPDARVFTLTSLFLGACLAVRLTIWWSTDEGYVPDSRL
jgi:hypothetical protein